MKEKHTQMMALENKLKLETGKRETELKRVKDDSSKRQQEEAAKATEAGKLMDKWRLKAEDAGRASHSSTSHLNLHRFSSGVLSLKPPDSSHPTHPTESHKRCTG